MSRPYPALICSPCGRAYGQRIPVLSSWHTGRCNVCENYTSVTEPRDFGHLKPESIKELGIEVEEVRV